MGTVLAIAAGVVTLGAFLIIVGASALVTGAVHHEEHHQTLTSPAPGPCTRAARRLLAAPGNKPPVTRPALVSAPAGKATKYPVSRPL
jgi:hypothetical protein